MAWPTTKDPKTQFATLRFTVSEMSDVDREAKRKRMTRSAYLRDCVHRCITEDAAKVARLKGQS